MSEAIKQFKNLIAKNPEFKAVLQGLAKDGMAVQMMPAKAAGEVRRIVGQTVEDVADFAGDVAGKAAEYAPRVQVGPEDDPITMPGKLGSIAKVAEGAAGLVEEGGEFLSDYKAPDELMRESALGAMDRRIQETLGEGQPSQREIFLKRKAEVEARKGEAGADEEEFDPPEWSDLSPEEQEAHRERKRQRISKRGGAEESYEDSDPTGEEYDSAYDGSADSQGRSAYEEDTRKAEELFIGIMGAEFDPDSEDHVMLMEQSAENMADPEYGELNPNQFALKMFREME